MNQNEHMKTVMTTNLLTIDSIENKTSNKGILQTLGEETAVSFEELYEQCYARIFRYFSFRLPSKENAEDLTQTVFLKICASLKNGIWNGQGHIHYIFTVARNTLIDYFRRSKHTPIASDEIVDSMADSATTSGPIEDRELREVLNGAMSHLRKNEVEAIRLRFFADLDYRNIAKIMGKREDAVRQLVHRGLRSLRGLLGELAV